MKKTLFFLVIAPILVFLTVSCSNDDGSSQYIADPQNDARIFGKWNITKQGEIINGNEVMVLYEGNDPGQPKDYVEFRNDNQILVVDYVCDVCHDPFIDPNWVEPEIYIYQGTWHRNGNFIEFNVEGDIFVGEILKISATTLKVKFDDAYILEGTRDN